VIEHVQLMVPVQAMKTKSSTVVQLNVHRGLSGAITAHVQSHAVVV